MLTTLRDGRQKAAQVAHIAIVAGRDRMISPDSAGALEGADVHHYDDLGHNARGRSGHIDQDDSLDRGHTNNWSYRCRCPIHAASRDYCACLGRRFSQ